MITLIIAVALLVVYLLGMRLTWDQMPLIADVLQAMGSKPMTVGFKAKLLLLWPAFVVHDIIMARKERQ